MNRGYIIESNFIYFGDFMYLNEDINDTKLE
jgi:hypothetical protein